MLIIAKLSFLFDHFKETGLNCIATIDQVTFYGKFLIKYMIVT